MNELAPRDQIQKLKEESLKLPQVEIPIFNFFADGVYVREMRVPAGTTITGKIHKTSTVDVLLEGSIVVVNDSGIPTRMDAPQVFESNPGVSKAGYAITDVRWLTIHGVETDTRDIAQLELELVVEDYQQYLEHRESLLLKEN
jgi:hypothetical protein